jgi:hypothetical protein
VAEAGELGLGVLDRDGPVEALGERRTGEHTDRADADGEAGTDGHGGGLADATQGPPEALGEPATSGSAPGRAGGGTGGADRGADLLGERRAEPTERRDDGESCVPD